MWKLSLQYQYYDYYYYYHYYYYYYYNNINESKNNYKIVKTLGRVTIWNVHVSIIVDISF